MWQNAWIYGSFPFYAPNFVYIDRPAFPRGSDQPAWGEETLDPTSAHSYIGVSYPASKDATQIWRIQTLHLAHN